MEKVEVDGVSGLEMGEWYLRSNSLVGVAETVKVSRVTLARLVGFSLQAASDNVVCVTDLRSLRLGCLGSDGSDGHGGESDEELHVGKRVCEVKVEEGKLTK